MTANDIHQWVEARLSEYLDHHLESAERARLETHLRECDRCQASLASLRQTISLLKQAPVPAPSRTFTIPVPRSEPRAARPGFGFLRAATAMATVLLFVVLGLDFFTASQFGAPSAAPVPAAQFAAPAAPTNIALAPTAAPAATRAPQQPASQPAAAPSATRAISAGAAEAQVTLSAADQTLKSAAPTAAAPLAPRAAITTTITLPSPSPSSAPTATVPAPTATVQAQARAEPMLGRDTNSTPTSTIAPPLRALEIGLGAIVIVLGALTIFAGWRK